MQVTLSTGRLVDIAPLTVHQCKQLLDVHDASGEARTWKDNVAFIETRLRTCYQAIQSAGGTKTLEELEMELTVPEVLELFHLTLNLTLQESRQAVAWAQCDSSSLPN